MAAVEVSYSLVSQSKMESGGKRLVFDLSFGDGALTYDTGIQLAAGSLGCPNNLASLLIIEPDADDGFVYKYDVSSAKLRMYQGDYSEASDGPLVELDSGATPAATVVRVQVEGW